MNQKELQLPAQEGKKDSGRLEIENVCIDFSTVSGGTMRALDNITVIVDEGAGEFLKNYEH